MPYKTGSMKGELTTPEIRKLIKAHNVLVSIKIPKGASREEIIALVEKNGYKINHEKQALVPRVEMQRKKTISLEKAKEITKPKPKTALEKQKLAEAKVEKEEKKKKEERVIRKKAVEEEKKREKPKPPPTKKPAKKEDEVRPISKVGRPRVDPRKIKVIERKEKPLTREEYQKLERKAVKDITPTEKKLMKEYEDKYIKESEPFKEKILTQEEKFYDILKYVITKYNLTATEYGYVDIPDRRKVSLINGLGSLIDKKKTSNFTEKQRKFLERAIRYLKSDGQQEKVKIIETFLSQTE